MSILLVDDSLANLAAYEAALEPLGHQVTLARSGDEALAKLLEQDFALIVLDMSMPGLSGLETARMIRGRPRSKATPLVFISGLAWTDEIVVDAYRLGALDFMTKPIQPEVLRAKAHLYLQLQHRHMQLSRRADLLAEGETQSPRDATDRAREDDLVALLGHELRNPLAIMSSALDVVALREGSLNRELSLVQRQVRHLGRIVDDLVDVSRIRNGTIRIQPVAVHVVAAVAEAIESVQPMIENRDHTISVEVDHDLVVTADPERIVQALAKVIDNAARYTPAGGRIGVKAARDGGFVDIAVTDNGNGIAAELLQRIFEPFVQEPRTLERSPGGLGLGLTLVRTLVELHGGRVRAESAGPRLGTTLTLHWPAAPTAPP